ncbi:MAG: hypothetical protein ACLRQ0_02540 [Monoglobales bacterium]|nr:hypothetical protein [Clostridia bacterium]MCI5892470.1 hypothetical protein [Clostridiales bacterium]
MATMLCGSGLQQFGCTDNYACVIVGAPGKGATSAAESEQYHHLYGGE